MPPNGLARHTGPPAFHKSRLSSGAKTGFYSSLCPQCLTLAKHSKRVWWGMKVSQDLRHTFAQLCGRIKGFLIPEDLPCGRESGLEAGLGWQEDE